MSTASATPTDHGPTPVGYQSWRDLLFVHWRVPAKSLTGKLPAGLSVDTWQGDAWIGLVAFRMLGIRPRGLPAIPWLSTFAETNVRTYVRGPSGVPGVWFASLEAARLPAVLIARAKWHLPYHWAHMRVERLDGRLRYQSRRRFAHPAATSHIEAEVAPMGAVPTPAPPGTLDAFLVERYVLYNQDSRGRLMAGRVSHGPYPLLPAKLLSLNESLLAAAGLARTGAVEHVVFSPGVDVEIGQLRYVDANIQP